jgi:hypothetical protein
MYGLLVLAFTVGALALIASKLTIILGFVIAAATFAFPLGLILMVGIGVALCCHNAHRASHWGHPE